MVDFCWAILSADNFIDHLTSPLELLAREKDPAFVKSLSTCYIVIFPMQHA